MHDPQIFRRRLAAQILGLLGATGLGLPPLGCNGDNSAILDAPVGGEGAGGAASSTTATTTSSTSTGSAASSTSSGAGGAASATSSGAGGAASATATGTGGATSTTMNTACFQSYGTCPTDPATALWAILQTGDPCPPSGIGPTAVASPPTVVGNQCCYTVTLGMCTGGRPYLVEDRARVATQERAAGTRGWSEGEPPSLAGLTREARERLAAAWAADALLEHASVASFSRSSLALLAAGAPAELIELTHRAALDEVRHARLCFALAAAYAGEDIAPGPFPLGSTVLVEANLVDLAVSTFKEGCLGETVAAVVAAEQLARAKDPAVVAALAQIAADEARHAELAWKTVAWAVRAGGSDVCAAVSRALCEAMATGSQAPDLDATPRAAMEAHGRLDAATTARVAASAMEEIVVPAARALLRAASRPSEPRSAETSWEQERALRS